MFTAAYLSSHSSSDSDKYKRKCIKAKVIRSSIFYAGEFSEACSRALYITPNHKEISSIMVGDQRHLPQKYANKITRHEQNKQILSHATSVGNKRKQTKGIKSFVIINVVSIVSYPSKK